MNTPRDSGAAVERFNTVMPELGSAAGWDRSNLAALLTLQPAGDGVWTSPHADVNVNGAVYGGQLIGQAVSAAAAALPDAARDNSANSLQVTFLSSGLVGEPMRYEVRRLLHGRNFIIQHVLGRQGERGERLVISANVSFHRGEPGPDHDAPMPADMPAPESLPSLAEVAQRHAARLPERVRRRLGTSRTVELRPLDAEAFLFGRSGQPRLRYWVRVREPLGDAPWLHQAALGYLSDFWFPMAALATLVDVKVGTGLYLASLNHTLWFHRALRADKWLLVESGSPFAGHSRGLSQGLVWRGDGALVATIAQEALFRGWVEGEQGWEVPGLRSGAPSPQAGATP